MKKKIGILGSTGSIGENTVNIISNNINDFDVIFLSTNKNIKKLYKQSIKLRPKAIIIFDKKKFLQKGAEQVDEGLPGWFGTFADMMTLLFAFFVLLAAISTIDPVKYMENRGVFLYFSWVGGCLEGPGW